MVAENLSEGIAFQIRATRDAQGITQTALAEATGMSQNNISRLESPDYGKHTISSLKRIADALDVALVVRLVPFSQYIDWLSGTPTWDSGLTPQALAVPSFEKEEDAALARGRDTSRDERVVNGGMWELLQGGNVGGKSGLRSDEINKALGVGDFGIDPRSFGASKFYGPKSEEQQQIREKKYA
jgi:transcriptional regulator with XRE-family HTH domain